MKPAGRIADIKDNSLNQDILSVLLADRASGKNIIWATDDYAYLGEEYTFSHSIEIKLITGNNGLVIRPRVDKDKRSQALRSKEKAEVFTPSWVCNVQNNLIDDAWFGKHCNRFNKELGTTWESTYPRKNPNDKRDRISFPNTQGKTWQDYVLANRLEVSCGEAPYLTSRYDTVTGKFIRPKNRIGLLDRKLRVITENASGDTEWLDWAEKALQSIYGYEWQGDNLLLARENILLAVVETYYEYYSSVIEKNRLLKFAEIISWNIWQMDGIKCVIPNSCHAETSPQETLFGVDTQDVMIPCAGCKSGDVMLHNGIYAIIMDWSEHKALRFADILKGGKSGGKI